MSTDYRIVALEEHMVTADVVDAWQKLPPRWRDFALAPSTQGDSGRRLAEIGDERIAAMDASGIDTQVLSLTAPGLQNLEPADAIRLQRRVNDLLADVVRDRPDRFQAFATLATPRAAGRGRGTGTRGDPARPGRRHGLRPHPGPSPRRA